MRRGAPTRRSSPNRGIEDERDRSTARTRLLAVVLRNGIQGVLISFLALRAWQQDRPWVGIAIFGGGALLVMGWAFARQLRDERRLARLHDQLRDSRRYRNERRRRREDAVTDR